MWQEEQEINLNLCLHTLQCASLQNVLWDSFVLILFFKNI